MSDEINEQVERRIEMHDIQKAIEANTATTQQIYTKINNIATVLNGKEEDKDDLGIVGIIASLTRDVAKHWTLLYFLFFSIFGACFYIIRDSIMN